MFEGLFAWAFLVPCSRPSRSSPSACSDPDEVAEWGGWLAVALSFHSSSSPS